jgi:hypothetical protein
LFVDLDRQLNQKTSVSQCLHEPRNESKGQRFVALKIDYHQVFDRAGTIHEAPEIKLAFVEAEIGGGLRVLEHVHSPSLAFQPSHGHVRADLGAKK